MDSLSFKNDTSKQTVLRQMFGRLQTSSTAMRRSLQQSSLHKSVEEYLALQNATTTQKNSLQSTYCSNPTRYQIVCFGSAVTDAAQHNLNKLRSLFEAGISPNPYDTKSGRFLIHTVCASLNIQALKLMIEFGGSQIVCCVDQFGRTPLHYICWNNEDSVSGIRLEMAKVLLQCNPQMIKVKDISGREPFAYAPKSQHLQWISLLNTLQHDFSESSCNNFEPIRKGTQFFTIEIVQMIVSGRMELSEIELFHYDNSLLGDADADTDTDNEINDRGDNHKDFAEIFDLEHLDLIRNINRDDCNDDSCLTFGECDELIANVLENVSYHMHLCTNQ